jgi:hypothetical protein
MHQIFSLSWYGEVAVYAGAMAIAMVAVKAIPRWAQGRPRPIVPAQARSIRRLIADAGIMLLAQAAVVIAIRLFHGPLSNDTWAFFTAFALAGVTQEILRPHISSRAE